MQSINPSKELSCSLLRETTQNFEDLEKSSCNRDPKANEARGGPKDLLINIFFCVHERLIYARVEPLIDPLLSKEQAGFRRGKSTTDHVVLLTQNIEDSFGAKKKAGAIFVDLTAAYDTVWHRGLTCKLLRLVPDKHMVRIIMKIV